MRASCDSRAVRHSSQEHPPSPTPVLRAELQVPERIERNNQGNNDREHRTQIWLTVGTWLAFIAAAVYAAIAYKQKVTMDATFNEVAKQTTIQRQHAVGTEAAMVELSIAPSNTGISIGPVNRRIIAARDVTLKFKAQRLTLPDLRPIEQPIEDELVQKTVPNTDHGGAFLGKEFSLPGYTSATFGQLQAMRETIKVEGTFSFNDGFDNVTSSPICVYWLTYQRSQTIAGFNQFVDCKGFEITLGNILKEKKQQTK